MKEWEYKSAAETENTTGKSRGPRGKGVERKKKKKSDTEKEERKRGGGRKWADASRARLKMVFEVLRGSLPFIVSLNELFMFLCILNTMRWPLNASSVAS